jgi:PAS domain S-box-containing protein
MNFIPEISPPSFRNFPSLRDLSIVFVYALAYFLAHKIALFFPDSKNVIMIVWPAAGIGLAAFLLNPRRLWPALTIAFYLTGFFANIFFSNGSIIGGLGTMTGSMVQSIGCAWFILYIVRDFQNFTQVKEVLALLVGTILINAFSACIGAGTVELVWGTPFIQAWQSWYISDGLGILLIAPFIVCWVTNIKDSLAVLHLKKIIECTAFILSWSIISYIIFLYPNKTISSEFHPYMLVALLAWPAMRFGMKTITIAMMILFIILIYNSGIPIAISSWGGIGYNTSQLLLQNQIFLIFLAFVGYLMSAIYSGLKKAECSLRKSEEMYRTIIETTMDGFWITDTKGNILQVNEAYCRITGYTQSELLAMHISDLDSSENLSAVIEQINKVKSFGEDRFEARHRRKDGSFIDFVSNVQYRNDEGGRLIVFFHDITERNRTEAVTLKLLEDLRNENEARKKTELELIKAKNQAVSANKLKDAFIANISHEIRTPLNGILGMTSIIKDIYQINMGNEEEALFEGIDISSKRIIRTVDMILNYSRLQVGEFNIRPIKINLPQLCSNLIKEFITTAKYRLLDLSFQNFCGEIIVYADEISITMAISNLLDNAIKYTKDGFVKLILKKDTGGDIILEMKDSGIGIENDYLHAIFEPYSQEQMGYGRAYEGIGLGLAIVNKVLDLNNFTISVDSEKGKGSTFSINFGNEEQPIINNVGTPSTFNIAPLSKEPMQKVLLIVEDDQMNQFTIKRFLQNNYRTLFTDSSDDVKDNLNKENIDLILMDISIKGSLNGLELTKVLKASKEFSHIPIIAVTAHAFESDKQNSLAAGCDGYLSKPYSKESLLDMISIFIDKS